MSNCFSSNFEQGKTSKFKIRKITKPEISVDVHLQIMFSERSFNTQTYALCDTLVQSIKKILFQISCNNKKNPKQTQI